MPNAIVKISKEAKRLQRLHKGWTWKDCIKAASYNYNRGKLGSLPAKLTSSLKRDKVGRMKRRSRKKIGIVVVPRKPGTGAGATVGKSIGGSLGKVSAGTLKSELKRRINFDIDKAVVRKFRATGKRIKRKIQKTITEKKAQLRRLL